MEDRFAERVSDAKVAHDTRVLADFVAIWCDGHHRDRERRPAETGAAAIGLYGRKRPTLCVECEGHLSYGERRRAFCPKDPKPFCAHCDTHCYRPAEREWQREMMRYAGPRSWSRGHAIDGIRHLIEARRHQKANAARRAATSEGDTR